MQTKDMLKKSPAPAELMNTDFIRLKTVTAPFEGDLLEAFDFDDNSMRIVKQYYGSVNLNDVAGVSHPDYKNKTWGYLKPDITKKDYEQPLKRGYSRLCDAVMNPGYYEDTNHKHSWGFLLYNGKYYVSSGCNRTIVGRYFYWLNDKDPIVNGVLVSECELIHSNQGSTTVNKKPDSLIELIFKRLFLVILLPFP